RDGRLRTNRRACHGPSRRCDADRRSGADFTRGADAPRLVPAVPAARVPDRSPVHAGCARRRGDRGSAADAVKHPAVFLDRDGTLIQEVGYLDRLERIELYPWTIDAVRALNRAD